MPHRKQVLIALSGALTLLPAGEALAAGTVSSSSMRVDFTAGSGDANDVSVSREGADIVISDAGAPVLAASPLCSNVDADTVRCRGGSFAAALGDGHDSAEVSGDIASRLSGSDGNDALSGGDGDDILDGGVGADELSGGNGRDRVTYANRTGDVFADLSGAKPSGTSGEGDRIAGDAEVLEGGSGDDSLYGGPGASLLLGGPGNDMLTDDESSGDTFRGGAGTDRMNYANRTDPVEVSLDGAANDGAADERDDVNTDIEQVEGGSGDDVLIGSGGADDLTGGEGDDSLHAGEGRDILRGGFGEDVLDGGLGDDVANGDQDVDTYSYATRTADITLRLDTPSGNGAAGESDTVYAERAVGGSGNDFLAGNDRGERFDGRAGHDVIEPAGGADEIRGGAGFDTVSYAARTRPVSVSLDGQANDGIPNEGDNADRSVEGIVGGSEADRLTGSSGPDLLVGGGGNDILEGQGFADVLIGEAGRDELSGGAGDDDLRARDGELDTVACGAGGDVATSDPNLDVVDDDCESVNPDPPGGAGGGADAGGAATGSAAELRLAPALSTLPKLQPRRRAGRARPRRITVRVAPRRDRRAPYRYTISGAITPAKGLSRQAACEGGRVSVTVKVGRRTVARRRAAVNYVCRYRVRLSFRNARRLGKGRLKLTVRFLGSDLLAARSARAVAIRAR